MKRFLGLACALAVVGVASANITVTNNNSTVALGNALFAPGNPIIVNSVTLSAPAPEAGQMTTGTYKINSFPATYGLLQDGVVLSSGDAQDYSTGPNTSTSFTTAYSGGLGLPATAAQEALLDQTNGGGFNHFDATTLTVNFTVPNISGAQLFFNLAFGSEEYPEFQGTTFIDGFGIWFDGLAPANNIAIVGGSPININHPSMAPIAGTELDGALAPGGNPLLTFTTGVLAPNSNHTLTFCVGDASDGAYDTTVYVSGIGVPEPSTLALLALGAVALIRRR